MSVSPLFYVRRLSSKQNYIVLDFIREINGYALLCKPYPKTGSGINRDPNEEEIHKQIKNTLVSEEILGVDECEFVSLNRFLNYSLISKKMMHRGITCNDLRKINIPQEHIDLITAFMEVRRNS
jgi:hypothetical protein